MAYDERRNPERETVSGSGTKLSVLQRSLEDSGRLECEARRMNPAAFGAPTTSACTPGSPGSFGADRITHNIYDDAGQLLQVQRAWGRRLLRHFDELWL